MNPEALKHWRKAERERLIAARLALTQAELDSARGKIDRHIERAFPGLAHASIALCWPIKNEYDARHLAHSLRERGARTALPVVVAPRQPLVFREWHPGGSSFGSSQIAGKAASAVSSPRASRASRL